MQTQPNYGISTSLKQSWWERLRKLQAAGITVVGVVKAGIEVCEGRLAGEIKQKKT